MTCPAHLAICRCSLDDHSSDIAHECTTNDCGGSWLDHPDDPNKAFVVRWPSAAKDLGIPDPVPPLEITRFRWGS